MQTRTSIKIRTQTQNKDKMLNKRFEKQSLSRRQLLQASRTALSKTKIPEERIILGNVTTNPKT